MICSSVMVSSLGRERRSRRCCIKSPVTLSVPATCRRRQHDPLPPRSGRVVAQRPGGVGPAGTQLLDRGKVGACYSAAPTRPRLRLGHPPRTGRETERLTILYRETRRLDFNHLPADSDIRPDSPENRGTLSLRSLTSPPRTPSQGASRLQIETKCTHCTVFFAPVSGRLHRPPVVHAAQEDRRILGRHQVGRVVEDPVVQPRHSEPQRRRLAQTRQGRTLRRT